MDKIPFLCFFCWAPFGALFLFTKINSLVNRIIFFIIFALHIKKGFMKAQDKMLRLFSETEGLKKKLASSFNYSRYGFSYDDIIGFLDDKIIHVFMRYPDKDYEELLGLCITSMRRVIPRLARKYGREVLVDSIVFERAVTEEAPQISTLISNVIPLLETHSRALIEVILDPPAYILARVTNPDHRIPSHLFLEYLDFPINKQTVKMFNKFRRDLFSFIREKIDPETLELKYT